MKKYFCSWHDLYPIEVEYENEEIVRMTEYMVWKKPTVYEKDDIKWYKNILGHEISKNAYEELITYKKKRDHTLQIPHFTAEMRGKVTYASYDRPIKIIFNPEKKRMENYYYSGNGKYVTAAAGDMSYLTKEQFDEECRERDQEIKDGKREIPEKLLKGTDAKVYEEVEEGIMKKIP
ncbi:MAG: hypothetical protein OEL89_03490 [Candidatus Peregrinibacteria bacterium]|nr:hypothetical protein [Candidatus Peregrinibacteria bacterium]